MKIASTGISGRFASGNITSDNRGNQPTTNLFVSNQSHLGRLHHGVRRLDHRREAARLNHAQCFCHLPLAQSVARIPLTLVGRGQLGSFNPFVFFVIAF